MTVSRTVDFVVPERLLAPPRLTERHPWLYPWAMRVFRAKRHLAWLRSRAAWANQRELTGPTYRVKRHQSLLLRQLGEAEMQLQHNKVRNLELAAKSLDGLVIGPGETFSFNKAVGNCTRRRGYVEGMKLSNGEAEAGVGGGICQMANLLVWMFMHSSLVIVERSEHSFDPFPDNGRVLPWGVGCSIVWNYVDLVAYNPTDVTYVVSVRVGPKYLHGELRSTGPLPASYSVFARNEEFLEYDGRIFRRNEIWRSVIDKRTGRTLHEELLKENCALVKYVPQGVDIKAVSTDHNTAQHDRHRVA